MAHPDDLDISHTMISDGPGSASTQSPLGHYLVVLEGHEPGYTAEVGADTVTIGRDPKHVLVFPDSELSRLHARVSLVRGELVVEDLKSTNGTFVDGVRIHAPVLLAEGSLLRLGRQVLKYERRDRREVERSQELSRDLRKARNYVMSLLPAPIDSGPIRTAWTLQPSTQLGGDAFGYFWLDPYTFVLYLVDVSGHGVGSAMHSVTALNVLRQRALPGVDFGDPAAVLASLNNRFQMDAHDGMYFTMWYGVYRVATRTLTYSSAGHHPAFLVAADRSAAQPLGVPNMMIGILPDTDYEVQEAEVPTGSTLYVFSDGVFEVVTADGRQWTLEEFVPHLLEPSTGTLSDPERLYKMVRKLARHGVIDDDFSLLAVTFQG